MEEEALKLVSSIGSSGSNVWHPAGRGPDPSFTAMVFWPCGRVLWPELCRTKASCKRSWKLAVQESKQMEPLKLVASSKRKRASCKNKGKIGSRKRHRQEESKKAKDHRQEESKKAKDKTDKQASCKRKEKQRQSCKGKTASCKSKQASCKGKGKQKGKQANGKSEPWQLNVSSCSLELVSSQFRKRRYTIRPSVPCYFGVVLKGLTPNSGPAGQNLQGSQRRLRQEALCTAPATEKAAVGQRRPRASRRLCVLRLPHEWCDEWDVIL